MRQVLAVLLLVITTACGTELIVESDTSWDGFIGGTSGSSVDGSGDHTFELKSGTTCWSFQKQTTGGRLKAYAKQKTLFGSSRSGEAETFADFGVVTGCTS